MAKIDIGTPFSPCKIDLDRLLETRLLITAGSGAGKSWTVRKFVEEAYGKFPIIILDVEGEFGTLREKYDFLLAGKDGDIPTDIRTADLLARKVLELNTSIIIDLYELKHQERLRYVRYFLDAMINAPKDLWKPFIIVLDEVHLFVPQSSESEASSAVIDLATRGRKRGFCLVACTQRINKADKDVIAELANNCLVGRTALDVDLKRVADILGFTSKEQVRQIRELEVGEFFAYGSAINHIVKKVKIGMVKTSHPKTGQRQISVVKTPTDTIKKVLAKLADLPKEAEQEAKDLVSLKAKVRELQNQLRGRTIDPTEIQKAEERGVQTALGTVKQEFLKYKAQVDELEGKLSKIGSIIGTSVANRPQPSLSDFAKKISIFPTVRSAPMPVQQPRRVSSSPVGVQVGESSLGRCERKILAFLLTRQGSSFNKVQIGALTGYSAGSGGFNNALSKLGSSELIIRKGDNIQVNHSRLSEVEEIVGNDFSGTGLDALEDWLRSLSKCEREIYGVLKKNPDTSYTKEELGEVTNYSPSSGGFNNALSRLCTLGLVTRSNGAIQFNKELNEL